MRGSAGTAVGAMQYEAGEREDTRWLANALSDHLQPGDVILLIGNLGAGKTAFVQDLAHALHAPEPATSPTFTLANFYQCQDFALLHVDTYRLRSVREFRDLALTDFLDQSVAVIEWGELVAGEFEEPLRIEIEIGEGEHRRFTLSSHAARWEPVLAALTEQGCGVSS